MPTTLPRRAGVRIAAVTALTAALTPLSGLPTAGAAPMAPGDNGTLKVHTAPWDGVARTPYGDAIDEPRVCRFYLDAANFETVTAVTWNIVTEPAIPSGATLNGTLNLPAGTGAGHTEDLTLPDGRYRLTWNFTGATAPNREKTFTVDCRSSMSTPSPAPQGGPPAGGGGIARGEAFTTVAGAAAVGLTAVGGVMWFRLRRRSHGA
ncbi:hypothetical protein SZN_18106 [Streptomyces zinciresistens K42]|uniref:Uncharacterized protein n=1 Tax=Streptomyces zinciresistens K42 TaxID=700597 RepID=G2GDP3_9ACTN|nr:hypothetical protein [Streptomyces zinciresistens]EGX58379.1 hypothetical protein SZN_18106 [Streptomyces zinciresistens K42]